MQTAKTLIRLGGSESLLGAKVILLVLSCGGSNDSIELLCMMAREKDMVDL